MERAAKQGIGAACIVGGIAVMGQNQTALSTLAGVVLVGIGIWLIFSD